VIPSAGQAGGDGTHDPADLLKAFLQPAMQHVLFNADRRLRDAPAPSRRRSSPEADLVLAASWPSLTPKP
jgi:hypothetical protein